ncbi:MAG: lytic murein transglycosylase [Zymomonas mobilis subsp. pomaceae]|uniref:Lytic murein transglycosylase n=1 Tax=Zymomonas mobilis subsp. pomaceae (strain ATCC 29192 / DSM 22645 / JCM 10191 / CCUG 17912 / NBRC 13757 / NCIMB 11200 / NRRL B-4491 / Barker I) TaxID=579138 RepID=F8EU25_ZYMMT|nr:lytic murein transglycosylase [Zymomonas mobilis]AEI37105.1 lytic murein transglycosylase [Zymomonas mobilis subsp. pomaceae ATCC 29192]MDX5948476.1 lytic murein transglycosylase [Zymomonas mobilis subsp. pomaceae]GEB89459.1 hypothetical protein ZMO02_10960 [Zymomonas mobilis subsp. pomaceae]
MRLYPLIIAVLLSGMAYPASSQLLSNTAISVSGNTQNSGGISTDNKDFQAFLASIRPQALASGVKPETFDNVALGLTPNARVIELDQNQPESPKAGAPIPPFAPYAASHVDAIRIALGQKKYQALKDALASIEQKTGVPAGIMLAIYGHESGYGQFSGNFDLLQSLATLAYDGRRRDLFTREYIAALQILDSGIDRNLLKGSWAGATGFPQFLPSVYLRAAMDGNQDGRKNIWSDEIDALASIANYLKLAGWRADVPWGVAVRVPISLDRSFIQSTTASPTCPRVYARLSRWQPVSEWRKLGIAFMGSHVPSETEPMALIEPDGSGATAWLVSSNYRSILDYNCSNFYALSVGLLADAITG